MPQYQISGLNSEGKREVLTVEAESVLEAVLSVDSRGYTDVTALTDDFSNVLGKLSTTSNAGEDVGATGGARPQDMTRWGRFFYSLKESFTKGWITYLLFYIWFGFRLYSGEYFQAGFRFDLLSILSWGWDFLLTLLAVFPFIAALSFALLRSSDVYHLMLRFLSWNEWEHASDLLPQLKGKIPDLEYATCKATILSGLGRFEEGVEVMERFRNDPEVPEWMYHARFPDICYPAGKVDLILEHLERAHVLAPEMDVLRIDYATAILRFRRDVIQAK